MDVLFFISMFAIVTFMKQKAEDDTIIAKKVLQEEIHIALSNYPTKEDLKKELSNYPDRGEVKMMLEDLEVKIDEKARGYRDQILTKMDQVVGELAQLREDRLFEKHDKKELEESIDDHEERIKKLEKVRN